MYFFKGHWWYDTIYAYGAGTIFAYYKVPIERAIRQHYNAILILAFIGFLIFYNLPNYFSITANITAVFLCLLLLLFTNKVRLKSTVLTWSGKHLFPLYIYQRLPMVVLSTVFGGSFMNAHPYFYIGCCLIITIIIAAIYNNVHYFKALRYSICQKKG